LAQGVGVWKDEADLTESVTHAGDTVFTSTMSNEERIRLMHGWDKAVQRTLGWIDTEEKEEDEVRKGRRKSSNKSKASTSTTSSSTAGAAASKHTPLSSKL